MNLEEAKKLNCACVYCLEFPNGMKYVGKSKDLSKRISLYLRCNGANKYLSAAIAEFGFESIDISILSQIECRDKIDLDLCLSILEIKYIRELGSIYPNGYNVSLGGEVLGIPIEYLTTDKDTVKNFYDSSKGVLVYDLNGDFVMEYPSIARMAYDQGVDEKVISGILNTKKMYGEKWFLRVKRYDYAPQHIEVDLPKTKERVIYNDVVVERERVKYKDVIVRREVEKVVERKVIKKPHILKYDMNGDFCGEYDNLTKACLSFSNSASGMGCGRYCKGYILFEKVDDDYPKQIEPYHVLSKKILGRHYRPAHELENKSPEIGSRQSVAKRKVGRPRKTEIVEREVLRVNGRYTNINNDFPVEQYDLDGNLIATYNNIRDAAADNDFNYANIWACVMGRTKKSQGYVWKRKE